MTPTIKDVAKKAGVSVATVSLVIHNNKRISEETHRKVNKVIKDLNYHPSRSARGLVTKNTSNVGFILTDDHFVRSEPFYTKIFLGTEFEAHNHDFYVLLTTVDHDFRRGDKLPRFVLERNVDAIIIAGKISKDLVTELDKCGIPLIFVDYYPASGDYPTVLIDNIKGGKLATEHLINSGHKNIGFIGGDIKHPSIYYRFQGYMTALENANLKFRKNAVSSQWEEPNRSEGYQAAKELYKNVDNLTAVFACNDSMAIGALQFFKDEGLKIPGNVSIVGFDDVEADLLINPPLTTIRVPKIEMGLEAMRLTVNAIKEGKKSIKKILVPVQLIERESVKNIA